MIAWMAALVLCWLIALLSRSPAWWRALNRGGAQAGRAVAWFCSGGLGWALARPALERERQAEALNAILARAGAPARHRSYGPTARSTGLYQRIYGPLPVPSLADQLDAYEPGWRPALRAWLCPACRHGNHGCQPGICRCPGRLSAVDRSRQEAGP